MELYVCLFRIFQASWNMLSHFHNLKNKKEKTEKKKKEKSKEKHWWGSHEDRQEDKVAHSQYPPLALLVKFTQ